MGSDTSWLDRHWAAVRDPSGPEEGITKLGDAIETYVVNAEDSAGVEPGNWFDPVLGPAVAQLLEAYVTLLNGEIGRLDASYLDSWARGVADRIGYDMDNGVYGG